MMTIILENKNNERLKSVSEKDNGKYLFTVTDSDLFPILSELADCDNEIVPSEDIPKLIGELETLKQSIKNGKAANHINEIIDLAEIAKSHKDHYLIFTPFEKLELKKHS